MHFGSNCLFVEATINMEKQLKLGGCLDWVRPQASILSPTAVKSRPLGKSVCLTPSTAQLSTEVQHCRTFFSEWEYIHTYVHV